MIKNLLARRYGSLEDFSQVVGRWCDISRATGLHPDTIRKAVMLYHKKGNRYIPVCARNYPVGRPRVITANLEAQITSWQTLNDMRFLSIRRRQELIRREHGVYIGVKTLAKIYQRNKIRYRQTK